LKSVAGARTLGVTGTTENGSMGSEAANAPVSHPVIPLFFACFSPAISAQNRARRANPVREVEELRKKSRNFDERTIGDGNPPA
jgi:hypothetical protein